MRACRPKPIARMVECAGVEAKLGFKVHPHMLRHACGSAKNFGESNVARSLQFE
jgi:site-specific recombinase XerC